MKDPIRTDPQYATVRVGSGLVTLTRDQYEVGVIEGRLCGCGECGVCQVLEHHLGRLDSFDKAAIANAYATGQPVIIKGGLYPPVNVAGE